MSMTRRTSFAAFAAMISAPVLAYAQGATNAPPGGIPSTTAPSNSQGTPAGGTGVIGGSRSPGVPMSSSAAPLVGGEMSTSEMPRSTGRRRRHRRHARHMTPSTAQ